MSVGDARLRHLPVARGYSHCVPPQATVVPDASLVPVPTLSWDELELPVLEWVHLAEPNSGDLLETPDLPLDSGSCEVVPGLNVRQFDEALRTLEQYGLIQGEPNPSFGSVWWTRLRPTAQGLRVLGEWPPDDSAALHYSLVSALRRLADDLPDEDSRALRRAASSVAKLSAGAMLDLAKEQIQGLGEDLTS